MQNRFKFRIWNKTDKKYADIGLDTALTVNKLNNNYEIQQCLGVKDKTGRLIYEGDLVLVETLESYGIAEVIWYPYNCCFDLLFQTDKPVDYNYDVYWNTVKVIASIADEKILDLNGQVIGTLTTFEETLNLLNAP